MNINIKSLSKSTCKPNIATYERLQTITEENFNLKNVWWLNIF